MENLVQWRVEELLSNLPVAHVGVIAEGDPYVTPVSFVWADGTLWFRTGTGARLDALRAHPRVCIELTDFDTATGAWASVILSGSAELVEDPDTERRVIDQMRAKYRRVTGLALEMDADIVPEEGAVIALRPDEVSGRASGSGIGPHTRPGRL